MLSKPQLPLMLLNNSNFTQKPASLQINKFGKRAEEKGQKMSETGKEAKIAAIRSSSLSEA